MKITYYTGKIMRYPARKLFQLLWVLGLMVAFSFSANGQASDPLNIDANGNVGIGTNGPQAKLHVEGNMRVTREMNVERILTARHLKADSNLTVLGKVTGNLVLGNNLEVVGTTYHKGKVGIGTVAGNAPLVLQPISTKDPAANGLYIYNPGTARSDHAIAAVRVNGTNSGNPFVSMDVAGVTGWSIGIDNADGQKLKISNAWDDLTVNTKMTINKEGCIGINTTNPDYPLQIDANRSKSLKEYYFMEVQGSAKYGTPALNKGMAIYANGGVQSTIGFYATSDQRHKQDLRLSSPAADLQVLNTLQVTDYVYTDVVSYGSDYHKGFIAQQVEAVYPQAVQQVRAFIPNIYDLPVSNVIQDGNLWVTLRKAHRLQDGDDVRLITETGEKEVVVQVVDSLTFMVTSWDAASAEVFVFGKKVDDFRTVNYDALYTLGISSIQELSRQLTALKEENRTASRVNEALKAQVSEMEQRLVRMESRLGMLEAGESAAQAK